MNKILILSDLPCQEKFTQFFNTLLSPKYSVKTVMEVEENELFDLIYLITSVGAGDARINRLIKSGEKYRQGDEHSSMYIVEVKRHRK